MFMLLLPFRSFADLPGGGVRWHTAFEITNAGKFPDYDFYYTYSGDEQKIEQGKTYSFSHPGAPGGDWKIFIHAKKKSSGEATSTVSVGADQKKETITVREIKDEAIAFDKITADYAGEEAKRRTKDGTAAGGPAAGNSNLRYILGGVSIAAFLAFGTLVLLHKKKA